jgi:hypothetical protein
MSATPLLVQRTFNHGVIRPMSPHDPTSNVCQALARGPSHPNTLGAAAGHRILLERVPVHAGVLRGAHGKAMTSLSFSDGIVSTLSLKPLELSDVLPH